MHVSLSGLCVALPHRLLLLLLSLLLLLILLLLLQILVQLLSITRKNNVQNMRATFVTLPYRLTH